MANLRIPELNSTPSIAPDDLIVIYQTATGVTKYAQANLVLPFIDDANFEWNNTTIYTNEEVVTRSGLWWQSLQDNNQGNVPVENAFWTQVNKVTVTTLKPWVSGSTFGASYSAVLVGKQIYSLLVTTPLPFVSTVSPQLDPTNWEPLGVTPNYVLSSISSGWITEPIVTINGGDPSKIDITAGFGYGLDRYTDPLNPILYPVTYAGGTAITVTNLAISKVSFLAVDYTGVLLQSVTAGNGIERRNSLGLAQLGHSDNVSVSSVVSTPVQFISAIDLIRDAIQFFGVLSAGNDISANGANLSINKSTGTLFAEGVNSGTNLNPNIVSLAAQIPATVRRRTQTGLGTTSTFLDVGNYDLSGTITALAANKFTNQRVYILTNGNIIVQYGQTIYDSLNEAVQAVNRGGFVLLENLKENAKLLCIISVKSTATALNSLTDAVFTPITSSGASTGGVLALNTDAIPEGTVNFYFTESRVRATLLTGLSLATSAIISATDSVLIAFGKLQAQISKLFPTPSALTDGAAISFDLNSKYFELKTLTTTNVAITLTLSNVVQGANQILSINKNTASDVVITLAGTGLAFYGANNADFNTTPVITLSGALGDIFELSFLARTSTEIGVLILLNGN